MDGTPAGWYDDPEDAKGWRYWDGSAWTDQRSTKETPPAAPPPGSPPSPPPSSFAPPGPSGGSGSPPPPSAPFAPGPPAPPPGSSRSSKSSRTGLWIVLAVVGVVLVVGIGVIVAVVASSGDSATEVIEKNLPQALEDNYADQGLDVTVSDVDCQDISDSSGRFDTTCTISLAGTSRNFSATVNGRIDEKTVTVSTTDSNTRVLDEDLAIDAAQQLVDAEIDDVTVLSCTLPQDPLVIRGGDEYTCDTDTDEVVTISLDSDNQPTITDVN